MEHHFLSSFLDACFNSCVMELYQGANLICFTRFYFRGTKSNVNCNKFVSFLCGILPLLMFDLNNLMGLGSRHNA